MRHVTTIKNQVMGSECNMKDFEGTTINTQMEIRDNHELFKAHIIIFGNKQHVYKLFHLKPKEHAQKTNDAVEGFIKPLKGDVAKSNITVSGDLLSAYKRQRRLPWGKPKGARSNSTWTTPRRASTISTSE